MTNPLYRYAALVLAFVLAAGVLSAAEEPVDVTKLLAEFSKSWPTDRKDYSTDGDDSWKDYALTLKRLVSAGDRGIAEVRAGLTDPNRQVRALSAQALGFLRAEGAVADLKRALLSDPWETVRTNAADSLGMIGTRRAVLALEEAKGKQENRDVSLHIKIALKRSRPLEQDALRDLLTIDGKILESVALKARAPEITLKTPKGQVVSLSDYRGKKNVLLVFFYGDG